MAVVAGEALECLDAVVRLFVDLLIGEPRPLGRRLVAAVLAGEQAAREREVRHEADAELRAGGQYLLFGAALEQAVAVLHDRDGRGGRGLAKLGRVHVRDAEVARLARLHQLVHRPERLRDRGHAVGPVVVEEVDVIGAEAA